MSYRDDRATCPSCGAGLSVAGTHYVCEACRGLLVPWQEVEEMIHEVAPDDLRPLDLRTIPGGQGAQRPCPRCAALMVMFELDNITIDRCGEHGLWFDGDELAKVLEIEGYAYGRRAPSIDRFHGRQTVGEAWTDVKESWGKLRNWLRAKRHRDGDP
jgi:Zn-finger nucleic acid-binding protein